MIWRHEEKYLLTPDEAADIRARISRRMTADSHYEAGLYTICSMYFDDDRLSAVAEKADGLSVHTKYRIRTYNWDGSRISLEKKIKKGVMTQKESALISIEDYAAIMRGMPVLPGKDEKAAELWQAMRLARLKPKRIVVYDRQAFSMLPLDVRVTFDTEVSGLMPDPRFLVSGKTLARGTPALQKGMVIMEVKYDKYLPYDIRMLTQGRTMQTSFSKYAACMANSGLITF